MPLGLDIGGANLKASDGEQLSVSRPFPIWKQPDQLPRALAELLALWPGDEPLAVTMTAELADCFATKAEGIDTILSAVESVAGGRTVVVWQTGGEFVTPEEARDLPRLVAAANWHALATWAGRSAPGGSALLIDIGSTTTDIIPLVQGLPATAGMTDVERLLSGELLYLGVRRTPLCSLAEAVTLRGKDCPLAAELFATTLDLALLAGHVPEDPHNCETADGRPATRAAAHNRLAHLVCCDVTELSLSEAVAIARQLEQRLLERIARAVERIAGRLHAPCGMLIFSGEGESFARRAVAALPGLADAEALSLTRLLGPQHSEAACAYALSRLAHERLD